VFTGVLWWAIVEEAGSKPTLDDLYLDLGKRYRFNSLATGTPEGRVIDCQPLQKSVLKVLLEQEKDLGSLFGDSGANSQWIPALALPYLALQEFCPAIPDIHDAWQEGDKQVVLLSDRSQWQLLYEVWGTQSLPTLQIVYSLDEMAKLWKALTEMGYGQSLLMKSNLRFDEDQTFGLQRLYADPQDTELSLKDLSQMWQQLLHLASVDVSASLRKLLDAAIAGEINSITDLRLQLQELADEQQNSDLLPPPPIPVQGEDYLDTKPQKEVLFESSGDDLPTTVIPMQLLSLSDAGASDNGRQRRHNEDCFGMDTYIAKQQGTKGQKMQGRGLYIVCDGMGGHASGEVASAMAVDNLQRFFQAHWQEEELPSREVILTGICSANQSIYAVNQEKASFGSGRMGTTLVMALVQDTKVAIAHVGDSRIYRVNRKWGLEQLTVDHEVGQRSIKEGVDPKLAYARPDAYQLTQALGPHDQGYLKPDITFLDLSEDTLLLLCSDGLSDNELIENNWATYLSPLLSSGANLEEGLHKLIALGNQKNGHDNLTGILVRIKVQPDLDQSIWL
jgi:protein phosphatase